MSHLHETLLVIAIVALISVSVWLVSILRRSFLRSLAVKIEKVEIKTQWFASRVQLTGFLGRRRVSIHLGGLAESVLQFRVECRSKKRFVLIPSTSNLSRREATPHYVRGSGFLVDGRSYSVFVEEHKEGDDPRMDSAVIDSLIEILASRPYIARIELAGDGLSIFMRGKINQHLANGEWTSLLNDVSEVLRAIEMLGDFIETACVPIPIVGIPLAGKTTILEILSSIYSPRLCFTHILIEAGPFTGVPVSMTYLDIEKDSSAYRVQTAGGGPGQEVIAKILQGAKKAVFVFDPQTLAREQEVDLWKSVAGLMPREGWFFVINKMDFVQREDIETDNIDSAESVREFFRDRGAFEDRPFIKICAIADEAKFQVERLFDEIIS
jgi:hypothetical protein